LTLLSLTVILENVIKNCINKFVCLLICGAFKGYFSILHQINKPQIGRGALLGTDPCLHQWYYCHYYGNDESIFKKVSCFTLIGHSDGNNGLFVNKGSFCPIWVGLHNHNILNILISLIILSKLEEQNNNKHFAILNRPRMNKVG